MQDKKRNPEPGGADLASLDLYVYVASMHVCAYNSDVNYQWDPRKASGNFRKHGVRFVDVVAVFEDELAITILDDHPDEERYVTLGRDFLGRIVVVVYTWCEDEIRIISARKATGRERQEYEST